MAQSAQRSSIVVLLGLVCGCTSQPYLNVLRVEPHDQRLVMPVIGATQTRGWFTGQVLTNRLAYELVFEQQDHGKLVLSGARQMSVPREMVPLREPPVTPPAIEAMGFAAKAREDGLYLAFRQTGSDPWEGPWIVADSNGRVLSQTESIDPASIGATGILYSWNPHTGQVAFYRDTNPIRPSAVRIRVWDYKRDEVRAYTVDLLAAFRREGNQYVLSDPDLPARTPAAR